MFQDLFLDQPSHDRINDLSSDAGQMIYSVHFRQSSLVQDSPPSIKTTDVGLLDISYSLVCFPTDSTTRLHSRSMVGSIELKLITWRRDAACTVNAAYGRGECRHMSTIQTEAL